jgi:hypothetical protein
MMPYGYSSPAVGSALASFSMTDVPFAALAKTWRTQRSQPPCSSPRPAQRLRVEKLASKSSCRLGLVADVVDARAERGKSIYGKGKGSSTGIVNLADPRRLFPAPLGLSGAA